MDEDTPRAHHDIGGVTPFMCLPVDTDDHALTAFDKRVDALYAIIRRQGLISTDELRRGIEAIPADHYQQLSYYQRWIRSIADTLLRKGVVTEAELQAALEHP